MSGAPAPPPRHEGVVALETALVMPLVVLLLVAVLGAVGVLSAQLSLEQAARGAARTAAVTGSRSQAAAVGARAMSGARVEVRVDDGVARVRIVAERRLAGLRVPLEAVASAPLEPGVRG